MEQNTTTTTTTPTPNSSAGKGMGIAGLVLGILAAIFSLIPCVGMWAIIPGIIGVILSALSMKQATEAGGSKGMAIGGLICSIVGIAIACYWLYVVYFAAGAVVNAVEEFDKSGGMDSLNKALEQLKQITDTTQTH
ncbi:MAG: hypothetical protein JWO32_348 [Bacteroidetes bacterium]|nr:hypothetical protein [Bacteroidota bacterium]